MGRRLYFSVFERRTRRYSQIQTIVENTRLQQERQKQTPENRFVLKLRSYIYKKKKKKLPIYKYLHTRDRPQKL